MRDLEVTTNMDKIRQALESWGKVDMYLIDRETGHSSFFDTVDHSDIELDLGKYVMYCIHGSKIIDQTDSFGNVIRMHPAL